MKGAVSCALEEARAAVMGSNPIEVQGEGSRPEEAPAPTAGPLRRSARV
jgi:hypothetical protein